MRILTYNIHGWRTAAGAPNVAAVGDVLLATGADIIGLNEVFYPRRVGGNSRPALEEVAERLGMHFVFGPCLRWPAQDDMPADAYGNALLSRWPIAASAAHHLTSKEEDPKGLLAGKEQRGLLETRILLPGERPLTVYVTHLDHTDEEARLVQLRVARTWLGRDRSRPHLVMGDFNAISRWDWPEAALDELRRSADAKDGNLTGGPQGPRAVAQMEKAGYEDLFARFGAPGARTYLGSEAAIRIDYFFASPALAAAATACTVWTESDGVSDHRPVMAEVAQERLYA